MSQDLTALFSPRSIAIVGVSQNPQKIGAIVLKNIILSGFKGKIYPINPHVDEIGGLKFFPSISQLPEIPDLAIIAIPSSSVNQVLEEIGRFGIKNIVIYSAGFKEIGPSGAELEKKLIDISHRYNLNILGPNCLGFVNNNLPLNASFGPSFSHNGSLRLVTQSGAIASSLLDWCSTVGLRFSDFVTIGNKSIITETDILRHWISLHPSGISPIGLYLESISVGTEFLKLARQITHHHPIFILKPGKTSSSQKAMQSHTGAMSGEDDVLSAALFDSGIIRCQELGEFFDLARALSWENIPQGPNVAVISNAGGPGVLSADTIIESGLQLASFEDSANQKLLTVLPRMASIINPVDVLGDALPERYGQALEIILNEPNVHSVVCIITPQLMTNITKTAEVIGKLSQKYPHPIFCSFVGGNSTALGESILNQYQIPSFSFPESAIRTLAKMWQWQQYLNSESAPKSFPEILFKNPSSIKTNFQKISADSRQSLNSFESDQLIKDVGVSSPASQTINTIEDAEKFATNYGWPIAIKLSSPTLLHKSDVGGIYLNLKNRSDIENIWPTLKSTQEKLEPQHPHLEIQAQQFIDSGIEVIVGVKRDPNFGPVLLFGAGGILAELIGDRHLHLLPIDLTSLKKLIGSSKIFPLLNGFRGGPVFSLEPLYDTIFKLSKLIIDFPEVQEIEINPLKITSAGIYALDVKTILMSTDSSPNATGLSSLPFKTAALISHDQLTPKIHHLVFESPVPLVFKAGQYINVRVADRKMNAYSIAAIDSSKTRFELLVDVSPDGLGSRYFSNLTAGSNMQFLGPFGVFTLKPYEGLKHIIFMGTGSGLSPLATHISELFSDPNFKIPVTLYFGVRSQSEIFWEKYFREFESCHPNFKLVISLSQPETDWKGPVGHITEQVKKDFPDSSEIAAYICGNRPMMEEAVQILSSAGCPQKNINFEKYY